MKPRSPEMSEPQDGATDAQKTKYFSKLATGLQSYFKFGFRRGHLGKTKTERETGKIITEDTGKIVHEEDPWRNVSEHMLVIAAALDVLGRKLGLFREDVNDLRKAAALHDFDKRITKKMNVSDDEAHNQLETFLREKDGDRAESILTLVDATKPTSIPDRVKNGEVISLKEKLMYLVDNMILESRLVALTERMQMSRKRNPAFEEKFGERYEEDGGYFNFEEKLSTQFQQEVAAELTKHGNDVAPEQLHEWLTQRIKQKIRGVA